MPINGYSPTVSRQGFSFCDDAACQQVPHSLEGLTADERRAYVRNAWPTGDLHADDRATLELAIAVRDRFSAFDDVDFNCALFGWRLCGFAPADRQPEDCDAVFLAAAIEWGHPAFGAPIVRCELGDDPVLSISVNEGETWRRIEVAELCDVLGDWLEARRAA
ncbi:hypothetical protein [Thauera aromatica]|uniref:hypothetical protein n=1 Tax=Thauera aromatica TaxID=59405 RepID=UPI000D16D444|nr:hypothetical protein [Thauera aromatica]